MENFQICPESFWRIFQKLSRFLRRVERLSKNFRRVKMSGFLGFSINSLSRFVSPTVFQLCKSPVQQKTLRFETKKPYDFDRNQKRSALCKKEQPNTTGKLIKCIWLLGQQPRAFQFNGTLLKYTSRKKKSRKKTTSRGFKIKEKAIARYTPNITKTSYSNAVNAGKAAAFPLGSRPSKQRSTTY